MSSKNFYGLTGDVTIDGGILNVANTNVSGNVTSTSLFVSNVATLGTTKTFVVRASGGAYYIDEVERKSLELHEGQTYIFDITASNAGGHPFKISEAQESGEYLNGVDDSVTNYIKFTVPFGAPTTLYYYCTQHSGMGATISISPTSELIVSGRVVTSGNVDVMSNINVVGNVYANTFVGDGSLLTGISTVTSSGLQVVTDNSPITTNTIQFTNPTTSLTASGNVEVAGNVITSGNVEATYFVGDGSQLSGIVTSVSLEEAVNTGNITSNTVQFTNVFTSLTASGNVEVAGNVITSGNVEAAYFVGDGSQLSGIVTSVSLEDAVNTGNITSNTVQFTNVFTSLTASGNVEVTGNVIAGYFIGDGSRLTGLPSGGGTSQWTNTVTTNELYYTAGSVGISNANPIHDLSIGSNLYVDDDATDGILRVTGNVHATHFVGDGSRLSGLPGSAAAQWSSSGGSLFYPPNPTATPKFIGIMNNAPQHTLSVGSNLFVDDTGSNVLVVDGDITAESMFLGALGIKPSYPLETVTDAGNVTPHTISFTNPTLSITTASNVEIGGALVIGKGTLGGSNLEVGEANLFVNTELTRVGIGTDQPAATLHVNGSLAVDGPLTFGTVNVAAQHGLEAITAVSNTTPLTIELQNTDTSLVTTANVEVGGELTVSGNAIVSSNLTVSGNATVSENLTVSGNTFYTSPMSVSVDSNVVAEYTGPHDRPLRKYPEVALSVASESASGENGYKVSWSSIYNNGNSAGERPFNAFNGDIGNTGVAWMVDVGVYGSDGTYAQNPPRNLGTATGSSTTANGEYIILQTPNKIKVKHFRISDRSTNTDRAAEAGKLYGSNDGSTWYELTSFSGLSYYDGNYFNTVQVNATTYYDRLALVVTNSTATSSATFMGIGELEYYGHEEGSGSLDTTLKSVYNVPATTGTQLEVYYDGQDYTDGFTITDKVANANATISSGSDITFDSTYKAWVFGGDASRTQTIKTGTLPTSLTGGTNAKPEISAALWFNPTIWGDDALFTISNPAFDQTDNQFLEVRINGNQDWRIQIWDGQHAGRYNAPGFDDSSEPPPNQWYHLAVSISGKTSPNTERKVYLNGIECTFNSQDATPSGVLNLPSNSQLELGRRPTAGSGATVHNAEKEFFGSIANFRLYSKALNAGQVKELYDYQKDYFLGSKSQVSLYKGHLGVGVAEPSGQLELAGDERIQAYPPRGMAHPSGSAAADNNTAKNITYIEGHGEFKASASLRSRQDVDYDGHQPYNAFDYDGGNGNLNYTSGAFLIYGPGSGESVGYNKTTGYFEDNNYQLSASSGTPYGHWLQLEMPYKINVKSYFMTPTSDDYWPQDWQIWASNDDNNWTHIHTYIGGTYDANPQYYTVAHTGHYKIYTMIVTRIKEGSSLDRLRIKELRYFGTPGPTTLDKGSLTLGRSLDVPRISRYDVDTETPRPEKLVLDLDTTVNSSPTDISGKGNHGAFYGNATYSAADKAFKFDGEDAGPADYIKGNLNNTGDTDFTVSLWLKKDRSGTVGLLWNFGGSGGTGNPEDSVALEVGTNNNLNYFIFSGAEGFVSNFGVDYLNKWVHIVATRTGIDLKIYLDGVDQNLSVSGTHTLQLAANTEYTIGARGTGDLGGSSLSGYISNFKVYDVVLEPSEVQKLYRLGRTGRSMVISDTAVGIGKVPEAQLDVRGSLRCDVVSDFLKIDHPGNQLSISRSDAYKNEFRWYAWSDGCNWFTPYTGKSIYIGRDGETLTEFNFHNVTTVKRGSSVISSSDDRLKRDEAFITNATDTLLKLKPQTYIKKHRLPENENDTNIPEQFEAGLIAQDVWYDAPELRFLVHPSKDANPTETRPISPDPNDPTQDPDYSSWGSTQAYVNYEGFLPYLIKSNQEIYNELQTEKVRNDALEARILALENA